MVNRLNSDNGTAPYAAVIFDMDGTLVDSESLLLDLWESAARDRGHVFSRSVIISTIGTTYDDTIKTMLDAYPGAPHEEIRTEASSRFRRMRENGGIKLRPGALEALEAVTDMGLPIGLCTSTRSSSAVITLESVGILRFFGAAVYGDQVTRGKPDPEPYLTVAARLGVNPRDCFAVEDSPSGARSALSAGMTVAVVPDIIKLPRDVLERTIILDSLTQVASRLAIRTR